MRILYGVQGTGNGHITRARALLPELQKRGCEVDFVFSGREESAYFDMEPFGAYRCFAGFTFVTQAGSVLLWPTVRGLRFRQFIRDVRSLDLSAYDLILSDFEPVSAWAAKRQKKPSIGLAHQYAMCYRIPGTRPWLKACFSFFTPVDQQIGIHWHHFDQIIIPPMLGCGEQTPVRNDEFILVYLPFEKLETIINCLQAFEQQKFIIYCKDINAPHPEHIQLKTFSRVSFPQDLSACSGVVCNTGFGVCSEAMVLGKKMLTRPVHNQIEQYSNALVLEELNRALVLKEWDQDSVQQWLNAPMPPRAVFPDVAAAVAEWIVTGEQRDAQALTQTLWQQCKNIALPEPKSAPENNT